ncbi:CATRA conflict system CASPASE/TPR repeat-associated protein [Actinomadura litoris]|uniref:CATRA conflict system CASPASE/TPR repeat-associated protein n=1 Tax=Actinomadura litoris TaxID=2678616 RepID=UPI001FA7042F|nr:CATRA conflict system CASPASE/TPR repeat-associated protein [Actinomadura litoris]
MGGIRVVEQELVAHVFAPLDGPASAAALTALRRIWERCADVLGMTEPVPSTGLRDTIPPSLKRVPNGAVAAREHRDHDLQMVLRREHDLLHLVLVSAAPRGVTPGPSWADHERLLGRVLGPTDVFIGTALLALGKTTGNGVPPEQAPDWSRQPARLPGGLVAWEYGPAAQPTADRRIRVLGAPDQDDLLSAWTWSRGTADDMPFLGRYLMHMAKSRYQMRVHATFPDVGDVCDRLRDGASDALSLARSLGQGAALADRLAELSLDQARASGRVSESKTMRRTVEIALDNAAAVLGPGTAESGFVADDLRLARWFRQRLDDEIAYLDAASEAGRELWRLDAHAPGRAKRRRAVEEPTIGIVSALPEEFNAVRAFVRDARRRNVAGDRADYVVGTMTGADPDRPHGVALTLMGDTANDAAADACANLVRSFPTVGYVLMVGIAAGVPDPEHPDRHVRLGDIVVSTWGVIDYDHVVDRPDGLALRQPFPRPSPLLVRRARYLEAEEQLGRRAWEDLLARGAAVLQGFDRPPDATDVLYMSDGAQAPTPHPDRAASGHRPGHPKVHYGFIGSADRALRNAATRDRLAAEHALRAVEMEGKGIGVASFSSGLEWLVVRGVSDYGDTRTDRTWRRYASLAAASYGAALLAECPPLTPRGGRTADVPARAPDGFETA